MKQHSKKLHPDTAQTSSRDFHTSFPQHSAPDAKTPIPKTIKQRNPLPSSKSRRKTDHLSSLRICSTWERTKKFHSEKASGLGSLPTGATQVPKWFLYFLRTEKTASANKARSPWRKNSQSSASLSPSSSSSTAMENLMRGPTLFPSKAWAQKLLHVSKLKKTRRTPARKMPKRRSPSAKPPSWR